MSTIAAVTNITVQIPRWRTAEETFETLRERDARALAAWKAAAHAAGLTIEAEDNDADLPGDVGRVRVDGRWYVLREGGPRVEGTGDDDLLPFTARLAVEEWDKISDLIDLCEQHGVDWVAILQEKGDWNLADAPCRAALQKARDRT